MELQELKELVTKTYSWDTICDMFDNEILDWDYGYSDEEIDEYDSRYDFYMEYNNKEAENQICDDILHPFSTSRNKLYEEGILNEFEEWLSNYSGINFN